MVDNTGGSTANIGGFVQQPCPSCGHCPTCGRSNWRTYPYWHPPFQPYIVGGSVTTTTGTYTIGTVTCSH